MNPHIVVIGSLNVDFVIHVSHFPSPGETIVGSEFHIFPGGKGGNQAYAAARLGGKVSMLGQVGKGPQAEWLKKNLASVGVDTVGVKQDMTSHSGTAAICIDPSGQNQILIMPGSNATFTPVQLKESKDVIASAGIVLLQLEIPMETVVAAAHLAKKAGAIVVLDPAPASELSNELLGLVDYLTPNENELAAITGGPLVSRLPREDAAGRARKLITRGAKKVIATLGSQGALLVMKNQEHYWPAIPVKVADTTAAGDAFNAGLAVALASGQSEIEAGTFAAAAAAVSVTREGAQPSMPSRAEVDELLKRIKNEE